MVQAVKGTKDLYGAEMIVWTKMERTIREVCRWFCLEEIRTPTFEYTELFVKSTGDTTDIVQKEMYTFNDKKGRSLTLKPEVTGALIRAFVEHKLYAEKPMFKYFYISPCFRYEQPQSGRQREFHQFGIEYYGSYSPATDAEVIMVGHTALKELGIETTLNINSLGGNECRKNYNAALKAFLAENLDALCPTCRERFDKNPLRSLDCKDPGCQRLLEGAPSSIALLDKACREHFDTTLALLAAEGINAIPNPKMVRGLDYYTRTVFEFISDDIGAQGTVCGGGRYDNLIEQSGGPAMGGIGFAMGMERLLLCMINKQGLGSANVPVELFIGAIGREGFLKAHSLANSLRRQGFAVEADLSEKSVKAQLKYANKIGAKHVVVLGDDELATGEFKLKNMETGDQTSVSADNLANMLSKGE